MDVPQEFLVVLRAQDSLAPAAQFAQNQIGMTAWVVDVAQDGCAALFARVIYNEAAQTKQSLRDAGRDSYVLNVTQGNVARGSGYEPLVNLYL